MQAQPALWKALLAQRCPMCRRGKIFSGWLALHPACSVCGMRFERESGYFLVSVLIGYMLGIGLLVPVCIALFWNGAAVTTVFAVLCGTTLISAPLIHRFARVLWLYVDQQLHPRTDAP